MGDLDEVSQSIGSLNASVESLDKQFEKHCRDDDRRHEENLSAMMDIRTEIQNLGRALAPVVEAVKEMKPAFDSDKLTKAKITGALVVLMVVGSVVWEVLK